MNNKILLFILILFSCDSSFKDNEKIIDDIVLLSSKISEDPFNQNLLLERVNYNLSKDNIQSAIYDLKKLIELDSLNLEYKYMMAKNYFNLSKERNANQKYPVLTRNYLENILTLNKDHIKANLLMGELMLAYARFLNSITYLEKSLELDYNQPKAHLLLGYAYKNINQNDNAINSFKKAININPDYKEAYIQLGQMYHLDNNNLAVTYYDNALKIDPDDILVLYNKAVFFQSILEWNKALEAYAVLHKVDPFHADGHYNLGFIHMELKLFDVATNNFSDAIYSNPKYYEAYYSRGICFETLGNIAQAESDYNRAIEINPDYDYAKEALSLLKSKNIKYNE